MNDTVIDFAEPSAQPKTQASGLFHALVKAQGAMPEAVLDKINPRFNNRYASLPSVLGAVKGVLSAHGLYLSTLHLKAEKIFRTTVTYAETGESIYADCPCFEQKDVQGHGSQQTYAMRYNVVALFSLIADEEEEPDNSDDDGNNAVDKTVKGPEPKQQGFVRPVPKQGQLEAQPKPESTRDHIVRLWKIKRIANPVMHAHIKTWLGTDTPWDKLSEAQLKTVLENVKQL